MIKNRNVDTEYLNTVIHELIKRKTGWSDEKIKQLFDRAKTINKSNYEMICEIENIVTYTELAKAFSEATGIPYAENITGDIQDIQHGRYIKGTGINGDIYYIWHPLVLKNIDIPVTASVAIVSKEIIAKYYGTSSVGSIVTAENAKERLKEIIKEAVKVKATDIHLYPVLDKGIYRLRFRILGDLVDVAAFQINTARALIATILQWSKSYTPSLQPDDTRRPQDGMFEVSKEDIGCELSVRVSCIWKSNMRDADIVMRLLYKIDLTGETIDKLGFSKKHSQVLTRLISRNHGIVLVTGATGSGKSRTVNTLLSTFPKTRNILTVEDPIEYYLPNGRQFQILEWEEQRGNHIEVCRTGFADFMKAFKRHDPDIVFVGELRDKETTQIAFHLAKTGHLVFGTLHASRATMVPEILIEDYGIERDVIRDNLLLSINQVLVKKLCDLCKKKIIMNHLPEWVNYLRFINVNDVSKELNERTVYTANISKDNNCPNCTIVSGDGSYLSKGYSGRTLIAEVYEFKPSMFDGEISSVAMERKLINQGNLLSDAVEKVKFGVIELATLSRLL